MEIVCKNAELMASSVYPFKFTKNDNSSLFGKLDFDNEDIVRPLRISYKDNLRAGVVFSKEFKTNS
jgi:hypothetical protein